MDRPIFYIGENECKAGGIILYDISPTLDEPLFLMINSRNKYEDFGGKSDIGDIDIEYMACRETAEESNFILDKEKLYEKIKKDKIKPCYSKLAKYAVFVVETDTHYDPASFGDKELHENIERTVEWLPLHLLKDYKFTNSKLHIRLRNKSFFDRLNEIELEYLDKCFNQTLAEAKSL